MSYKISNEHDPEHYVLSIRRIVRSDQVPQSIGEIFQAVGGYLARLGSSPNGRPFTRIHGAAQDGLDLEAGFPVSDALPSEGDIELRTVAAGEVATTYHVGPYEGLEQAREALRQWASKNERVVADSAWEFYETDPGQEPDPAKWRTRIVMPLKK